jgi:demethylmenaquinone methyltransferase / 2-methoxy-6-polyprenyl-1,4-benzoquinol methylase
MKNFDGSAPKTKPLHGMFTAIPQSYDLINRIITLGMDRGWRTRAARECLKSKPSRVLDLCCGTGDMTVTLARLAEDKTEIIGVDYSQPMLDIAMKKAAMRVPGKTVSFVPADAVELPFTDQRFDVVAISFAFRNLTYKNPLADQHLSEVYRVLKPGGRFVIVESSQPRSKLIRFKYHLYMRWFVFGIGYLLSGNKQAYHYLAESASRFYNPEEVADMLIKTGFRQVSYSALFMGAAGIHVAVR